MQALLLQTTKNDAQIWDCFLLLHHVSFAEMGKNKPTMDKGEIK
tara:strand:- start:349 stop:480 length:132 start_codon:yes stop_codon:yes gene_type:complete